MSELIKRYWGNGFISDNGYKVNHPYTEKGFVPPVKIERK
jgi:hypothetical protein